MLIIVIEHIVDYNRITCGKMLSPAQDKRKNNFVEQKVDETLQVGQTVERFNFFFLLYKCSFIESSL